MFIFEKFPVYIKSEVVYKKLSDILSNQPIDHRRRGQLLNPRLRTGEGKKGKNKIQ